MKLPQSKYVSWGFSGGSTDLIHCRSKMCDELVAICGYKFLGTFNGRNYTTKGCTWKRPDFRDRYIQHDACPECLDMYKGFIIKQRQDEIERRRNFRNSEDLAELQNEMSKRLRRMHPLDIQRLLRQADDLLSDEILTAGYSRYFTDKFIF